MYIEIKWLSGEFITLPDPLKLLFLVVMLQFELQLLPDFCVDCFELEVKTDS